MQFLNPAAFYLLGAIPIVVALHFLKLRRHTHLVPSIMLWHAIDEDRRANVPFQRLRNLLLPILQVLFLLLVTFSAARPALRKLGFMPGRAILIVDNSATMQSTETEETRLDLAKQAAQRHIENVSAGGGMMLMVTSATESDAYIREAFTTDTAKLRSAIDNIPKSDTPRNLRPAFDAAARYVASSQDKIFLISDSFENLPETSLPVYKIGVGNNAENIGIIHFSVEIVGDQYEVLASIQNFTDTVKEVEVELAVENAAFDSKTVPIPSKETKPVLFEGEPEGLIDKIISVHLLVEDDFTLDNSAAAVLSDVSRLRILLVSNNQNSLLPALLAAYGEHVDLHQVVPADYLGTGDADIAIFDGGTRSGREALARAADAAPGTHLIFINPGDNLPFIGEAEGDAKEVATPVHIIKTAETHPLMTNVSLQKVRRILKSMSRTLPLSGRSLVETEEGTLIWIAQAAGRQFLVFEFDAFNLEVSNFAMTIPDAPLFVYQSLARFESGTATLQPLVFADVQTRHAFKTGESIRITSIAEGAVLHIEKPDKKTVKVTDSVFTGTDQVGVYTLYADDSLIERFTVNLLNADTSALSHSAATAATDTPASIENGFQPMTQEVWRIPALIACMLLLLEWWFYHREDVFGRKRLDAATP